MVNKYKYSAPKKAVNDSESDDDLPFDPGALFGNLFKKDDDIKVDGNKIFFHKEITSASCLSLIFTLKQTSKKLRNASELIGLSELPPIILFINSSGGDYYAGVSAYDHIKNMDYPIHTVIDGMAASAATFISLAGKKRYIMKSGWVLIHQLKTWMNGYSTFEELKDEMVNSTNIMKSIGKMYKENTSIPKKRLDTFFKHDLWIDSAEAIELGIVDGIYGASSEHQVPIETSKISKKRKMIC